MIKQLIYKNYEPVDLDRLSHVPKPQDSDYDIEHNRYMISFNYPPIGQGRAGEQFSWKFTNKEERDAVYYKVTRKIYDMCNIFIGGKE